MRDYKIGDWVIFINKNYSDEWKEDRGISLYEKLAKIIYINKSDKDQPYLLEFKDYIGGYDGGYDGDLAKVKSKEGALFVVWSK